MKIEKPNLLLVGCQKCGTTYMHHALTKTDEIFGSNPKELHFFDKEDYLEKWDNYEKCFRTIKTYSYYLESTPSYFTVLKNNFDIAKNIKSKLPSVKIMVLFRNPVKRYESAFIHHLFKNRFSPTTTITEISDDYQMLSRGFYGRILTHWLQHFPDINYYFYEDLAKDKNIFFNRVLDDLNIDEKIPQDRLNFRINDKRVNFQRNSLGLQSLPKITHEVKAKLIDYYLKDIEILEALTSRDLSSWKVI